MQRSCHLLILCVVQNGCHDTRCNSSLSSLDTIVMATARAAERNWRHTLNFVGCLFVCLCTRAVPRVHPYISEISTYLLILHLQCKYITRKQRPLGNLDVAGRVKRKFILTTWDGTYLAQDWAYIRSNKKKLNWFIGGAVNVSWLRRLVCRLLTVWPEFDPGSVQMKFFFDKVTLGQVFLQLLQLSPVLIIPPVVHTHSFITDVTLS